MSKLTGFTLFRGSKGKWQMSTRLNDDAWSVRIVEDEVAQQIFDRLQDLEAKYPPNSIPRLSTHPQVATIAPLFELESVEFVTKKVRFTRGN